MLESLSIESIFGWSPIKLYVIGRTQPMGTEVYSKRNDRSKPGAPKSYTIGSSNTVLVNRSVTVHAGRTTIVISSVCSIV